MSTPLPVPSKVAVTAIRGLIVGTTCSLALITEDRRRRIKNAHSAINNAEKIRSARNYHAGGAALALAIEEDPVLFDHTSVPRPRSSSLDRLSSIRSRFSKIEHDPLPNTGPATSERGADTWETVRQEAGSSESWNGKDASTRSTSATQTPARAKLKRLKFEPPTRLPKEQGATSVLGSAQQKLNMAVPSSQGRFAFPTRNEIYTMVEKAAATKDRQLLGQSVDVMAQHLAIQTKGVALDDLTLGACALLCRTCQGLENMYDAREILRLVREIGPLSETAYYSFEPLNLLDGIISKLEVHAASGQLHKQSIARAVDLYCVRFPEEPQVRLDQGFSIGRRLIELAFAARSLAQIDALYWRCTFHRPVDVDFTQWYISQLHEAGDHKTAIKFFCLVYAKMSPSFHSVERLGATIVESVRITQGHRASAVLRALDQICSPDDLSTGKLHTTWVIKLLEAHWTRKHNIDETAALFATINRPLAKVVKHPEGVWRVMMELSLKAGRPDMADSYLKEAKDSGAAAWDYLTVMLFARVKAEAGDWDGVFEDVKSLQVFKYGDKAERVSRRLVPILKMYAAEHTAAETDAYLRRFITELRVPVCRNMVTLVATQYGSIRDPESLRAWLDYCATQGFEADATFSNAILSTCRHTWKVSYQELRKLYRQLQDLGEDLTDKHTERMMADAALSQRSSHREWRAHIMNLGRSASSRAPTRKGAAKASRNYSPHDIILMMKEELVLRRASNAVNIYRQATRQGVDLPVKALHLAMKAALLQGDAGMDTALDLMQKAEKRGVDTSSCKVRIIFAQLNSIDPELQFDAKHRAVMKVLNDADKSGVKITDVMLNQAAYRCLRADADDDAIKLALRAAEVHKVGASGSGLCFNAFNFSVLLHGFLRKRDLTMLKSVVERAKTMPYWTDLLCFRTVKAALAAATRNSLPYPQAAEVLKEAKNHCIEARKRLKEQGVELQEGVLEIIRSAVKSHREGLPAECALEERERQERQGTDETRSWAALESEMKHARRGEEIMLGSRHAPSADRDAVARSKGGSTESWADELEPAGGGGQHNLDFLNVDSG